ncbi:hypothetical protein [Glycomyces albidus]|uniref:Uncharacterized protein n=1 Tax=Glycomyces albidus TaxID=2656774 RepID=A0A6L5GGL6_9ACTN|nr:hypothetical protein [Glycomyces albidus]MQM28858.1 hypothetical protein [Glycomyces albidus]
MLTLARSLDNIQDDLDICGYTLLRAKPQINALTDAATGFGAHIGAKSMGVKLLEAADSGDWLARHTENLTDSDLLEYFALGCLTPATFGGATYL